MTAAIATSMAVGPHWQSARVLVDSGSEHPPLISQDLAVCMGMTGVRAGGATQADSACLQLFDIVCLDLAVNGKPISHNFLSSPLSHYDIILGKSWLRQHRRVLDYAHNDLWQWAEAGLQQLTFSKPRPSGERRAVWAWAEAPGQEDAVGSAASAIPSSSYL